MGIIQQIFAVTSVGVSNLRARFGTSCVLVFGIAGVVGVLVSVGSMTRSLEEVVQATGLADRAIVLSKGAESDATSSLTLDEARVIADAPGIARADGDAMATVNVLVSVHVPRKRDGTEAGLTVRGVGPHALAVSPDVRLVEGRWFDTGVRELVVGQRARAEFVGVDVGDEVRLRDSTWRIVGVYESDNAYESGFLADAEVLRSAYQRTGVNSVTVALESPAAFETLQAALLDNPSLSVDVERQTDYYRRQSRTLSLLIDIVTNVVVAIMAVGAVLAALNTMYSSVSQRSVEIATLRALGFGPTGIVVSVLVEAFLLAMVGATIGAGVAFLLFGGSTVSMGSTTSVTVFELRVTPDVLVSGVMWACVVGLIGGLFPALRAARMPVVDALRDA